MAPRGFINPTPKTESARSALSSFTCTLCNKSYSRHPEYEAHISSYDHQHRKRLQDLKQLSRDPNAAEKARRAEKKVDAEAGLRVIDTNRDGASLGTGTVGGGGGGVSSAGGFKKGGFKSSFTAVKGPVAPTAPTRKNVLGDDDDDDDDDEHPDLAETGERAEAQSPGPAGGIRHESAESDTDEEIMHNKVGGDYYDPRRPTDCWPECVGARTVEATSPLQ
ncbi:hypothetical protein P170DRAFT_513813 [Aspergillus steynii IBT 23096]|uniref:C2H2-type domain-containing protein n=1 Tax=Aspergillus steynii IBT 23096 TaxID=1392250 RepID=A0A2I2FVI4_9EURO|nr:uncharacterized protein P170DRAFT_513813 [Aspergillus steynii IBT 23096]PLB44663.1 hypothetical protein P170DRAFT_513813 [Aspergillus steynii IBT 23096]